MVLARIAHTFIINENSIFDFEFETANQPGFEPGSPRPKAAMLPLC